MPIVERLTINVPESLAIYLYQRAANLECDLSEFLRQLFREEMARHPIKGNDNRPRKRTRNERELHAVLGEENDKGLRAAVNAMLHGNTTVVEE